MQNAWVFQSVKKVPSSQRACRRTAGIFSWLKVAPSAHIGGFAPYHPQYIAKKHPAGGRGRVRQHPTSFPLPFGEGVRGWGKFKLTNTFSTSSNTHAECMGVFVLGIAWGGISITGSLQRILREYRSNLCRLQLHTAEHRQRLLHRMHRQC